jgi:hypothetical protein
MSNDALASAFRCRGGAAADPQFIENLMKMPFRRPDANRKLLGDLSVRKAEIDQAKRFELLPGQTRFGRHASFPQPYTRTQHPLANQQVG